MNVVPIRKEFRNLQSADVVPLFLMFKKASGLSPRTLSDYRETLDLFFRRFPDGMDYPRERTQAFLGAYENPSSFNLRYAYLQNFWTWAIAEGYFRGDQHPMAGLKKRRPQGRVVQLSEVEVARLLKQPDRKTFAGLRDYAAMLLQIDCAIRPGEALQLMPENFDPERGEISIPASIAKTRVSRILPVSQPTVEAISKLLVVQPEEWGKVPIFTTCDGRAYRVIEYSRRVKTYADKAGLKNITAYSLRHAAAILMLRKGVNSFVLQNIMGHTNPTMTRHYLALTSEDAKREHRQAAVILSIVGADESQKNRRIRKL